MSASNASYLNVLIQVMSVMDKCVKTVVFCFRKADRHRFTLLQPARGSPIMRRRRDSYGNGGWKYSGKNSFREL